MRAPYLTPVYFASILDIAKASLSLKTSKSGREYCGKLAAIMLKLLVEVREDAVATLFLKEILSRNWPRNLEYYNSDKCTGAELRRDVADAYCVLIAGSTEGLEQLAAGRAQHLCTHIVASCKSMLEENMKRWIAAENAKVGVRFKSSQSADNRLSVVGSKSPAKTLAAQIIENQKPRELRLVWDRERAR